MKKLAFVFIMLSFTIFGFSQQIAQVMRSQKTMSKKCEVSSINVEKDSDTKQIQIDIFFTAPVDSRSVNESTVFINSRSIGKDVKIVFNREASQARFTANADFPVTITLKGLKNSEGNPIPEVNAIFKGADTWTAR